MRHRPKRENYPSGTYGDMDYQEYLERYCTYLENKNKALTKQCNIDDVVGSDILILLERKFPTVYEIHHKEIRRAENLILTTTDKEFAERLVDAYNHYR